MRDDISNVLCPQVRERARGVMCEQILPWAGGLVVPSPYLKQKKKSFLPRGKGLIWFIKLVNILDKLFMSCL